MASFSFSFAIDYNHWEFQQLQLDFACFLIQQMEFSW